MVQSLSGVQLFETLWTAACQAPLSTVNPWSLLKLMSIELVMLCNHLILCHTLLLSPSIFPSIWVFSNESTLRMRWPKYKTLLHTHKYNQNIPKKRKYKRLTWWAKETRSDINQLKAGLVNAQSGNLIVSRGTTGNIAKRAEQFYLLGEKRTLLLFPWSSRC